MMKLIEVYSPPIAKNNRKWREDNEVSPPLSLSPVGYLSNRRATSFSSEWYLSSRNSCSIVRSAELSERVLFRSINDETAANLPSMTASRFDWENLCRSKSVRISVQRSIQRRRHQKKFFESIRVDFESETEIFVDRTTNENRIELFFRSIDDSNFSNVQNEISPRKILVLAEKNLSESREILAKTNFCFCKTLNEVRRTRKLFFSSFCAFRTRNLGEKRFVSVDFRFGDSRRRQRNVSARFLRAFARKFDRILFGTFSTDFRRRKTEIHRHVKRKTKIKRKVFIRFRSFAEI